MRETKPPIHLLLVCDDRAFTDRITNLLAQGTRARYSLDDADSIDSAMEALSSAELEICLVDYHLEGNAGCDLIRRAQLQGVTIPLVMFTESDNDALDIEAIMAGASDLISRDELHLENLERTLHVAMIRFMAEMRLRRMASRDHLTKVFNRAHFEKFASTELLRANRTGQKAALMLLDVDKFKAVNDTFGHSAGDDMLRTVAQICQNEVRALDCVGRFGGDEFVILLAQTGLEGAEIVAERIRASLDGAVLRREYDAVPVSVSIGIASTEQDFVTYTPLFEAADAAVRKAKESGRNCVMVWEQAMADGATGAGGSESGDENQAEEAEPV